MIRFSLICAKNHEFESWFKDNASFEKLAGCGQLQCPVCGTKKVSKSLMAPNIVSSDRSDRAAEVRAVEVAREILTAVGAIKKKIEQEFNNVGDDFAEEARKIHYGEAEERSIYGKASSKDIEELDEEGIEVFPLPEFDEKPSDA